MTAARLSEAAIQRQIREYLAVNGIDSIAIPNGSVLAGDKVARAKQMNKLKRTGLVPGAADLLVIDRRDGPRMGFVEVKAEGGYQQPSQRAFEATCRDVWNVPYAVCRSVEDVAETLRGWNWR